MNLYLLLTSTAIYALSKVVILLTIMHLLFTISYDHAIIISLAIISMSISDIYLKKVLKGVKNENQ